VTHAVDFLHLVDRIIVMKDGRVVANGSFEDLKESEYLAEVLKIHHGNVTLQDAPHTVQELVEEEKKIEEKEHQEQRKGKQRSYSITPSDAQSLIKDENEEQTKVGWPVYKKYIEYAGGWKLVLFTNIAMTCFLASKLLADYYMGAWSQDPSQFKEFFYYFRMTFIFTGLTSFFVFVRCSLILSFTYMASKRLHREMVNKVVQAPINLYFDVTPIGRILNRFSEDLSMMDTDMGYSIGTTMA